MHEALTSLLTETKQQGLNQTASEHKTYWAAAPNIVHKREHTGSLWCSPSESLSHSCCHRKHQGWSKQRGFRGEYLQLDERSGCIPFVLSGSQCCSREPSVSTNSSWHTVGSYSTNPADSSELPLFVHRFSWALWPPPWTPISWESQDCLHWRRGNVKQHEDQTPGPTHAWEHKCEHYSVIITKIEMNIVNRQGNNFWTELVHFYANKETLESKMFFSFSKHDNIVI